MSETKLKCGLCDKSLTKKDMEHEEALNEKMCVICFHTEWEECDSDGDKREGWLNCSICGQTNWDSLRNKEFTTNDLYSLMLSNRQIAHNIAKGRYQLLKKHSTKETVKKVSPMKEHITTLCWYEAETYASHSRIPMLYAYVNLHDAVHGTSWEDHLESSDVDKLNFRILEYDRETKEAVM